MNLLFNPFVIISYLSPISPLGHQALSLIGGTAKFHNELQFAFLFGNDDLNLLQQIVKQRKNEAWWIQEEEIVIACTICRRSMCCRCCNWFFDAQCSF